MEKRTHEKNDHQLFIYSPGFSMQQKWSLLTYSCLSEISSTIFMEVGDERSEPDGLAHGLSLGGSMAELHEIASLDITWAWSPADTI